MRTLSEPSLFCATRSVKVPPISTPNLKDANVFSVPSHLFSRADSPRGLYHEDQNRPYGRPNGDGRRRCVAVPRDGAGEDGYLVTGTSTDISTRRFLARASDERLESRGRCSAKPWEVTRLWSILFGEQSVDHRHCPRRGQVPVGPEPGRRNGRVVRMAGDQNFPRCSRQNPGNSVDGRQYRIAQPFGARREGELSGEADDNEVVRDDQFDLFLAISSARADRN